MQIINKNYYDTIIFFWRLIYHKNDDRPTTTRYLAVLVGRMQHVAFGAVESSEPKCIVLILVSFFLLLFSRSVRYFWPYLSMR